MAEESILTPGDKRKVILEYLRHLTTLASGSLLVGAAFSEKLFPNAKLKPLLIAGLIFFFLSIVGALIAYTMLVLHDEMDPPKHAKDYTFFGVACAWAGFLLGMAALGLFAMVNIWQ